MSTLHTVNGKPVAAASGTEEKAAASGAEEKTPAQTPAPATHKAECGDVGEVGEAGALGTNAA